MARCRQRGLVGVRKVARAHEPPPAQICPNLFTRFCVVLAVPFWWHAWPFQVNSPTEMEMSYEFIMSDEWRLTDKNSVLLGSLLGISQRHGSVLRYVKVFLAWA